MQVLAGKDGDVDPAIKRQHSSVTVLLEATRQVSVHSYSSQLAFNHTKESRDR